MKHEYLQSSTWYREKISDPWQVITDCFSAAKVSDYRKDIRYMLQAACAWKVIKKRVPSDLLYLMEKLESLINAAWLINEQSIKYEIPVKAVEMFRHGMVPANEFGETAWHSFPRVLAYKELAAPQLAIKKFFQSKTIHEWKEELKTLLQFAFSKESIFEAGIPVDTLTFYIQLVKLTEALHWMAMHSQRHE